MIWRNRPVKETDDSSVLADLVQLDARARRALEEARRLSDDHRFITFWCQMRPRSKVRLSPILDE
jgi:hypothetical protein